MYAMFVKEMQQFFRSLALKIAGLLIVGSWVMVYFISQIKLPDLKGIEVVPEEAVLDGASLVGYLLAIALMNIAALIAVLGSSAGRWRLELGDPAFAPGITTDTPAWQLALGKWGALMVQVLAVLLLCGLLPFWVGIDTDVLALLAEDRRRTAAEAAVVLGKIPLVLVCMTVVWSSATLALCSLKPRSRGKVDIGMIAAMLFLAPQAFGLLAGSGEDNWVIHMLIRAVVLVAGSLTLITAGVSAPGANRLVGFKLWMAFALLVIVPLLWKWQGIFNKGMWANMLEAGAGLFLLSSLFERMVQSRRVLTQLSNPVLAVISFPFTTGVLNSMVLAAGFLAAAYFLAPSHFDGEARGVWLVFAAAVSLCNMAGFLFESKGKKFIRLAAFVLLIFVGGIVAGIAEQHGLVVYFKDFGGKFAVIPAIFIIGCNIPLIINYNSRKKNL